MGLKPQTNHQLGLFVEVKKGISHPCHPWCDLGFLTSTKGTDIFFLSILIVVSQTYWSPVFGWTCFCLLLYDGVPVFGGQNRCPLQQFLKFQDSYWIVCTILSIPSILLVVVSFLFENTRLWPLGASHWNTYLQNVLNNHVIVRWMQDETDLMSIKYYLQSIVYN